MYYKKIKRNSKLNGLISVEKCNNKLEKCNNKLVFTVADSVSDKECFFKNTFIPIMCTNDNSKRGVLFTKYAALHVDKQAANITMATYNADVSEKKIKKKRKITNINPSTITENNEVNNAAYQQQPQPTPGVDVQIPFIPQAEIYPAISTTEPFLRLPLYPYSLNNIAPPYSAVSIPYQSSSLHNANVTRQTTTIRDRNRYTFFPINSFSQANSSQDNESQNNEEKIIVLK
ncbi:MAG: hypothetical protein QM652_09355 [Legionella sp.]|uniref:hypothetical protein n=1 Tax=Legionella sp. TaxID=459 RepID=UPI0039E47361